MAGPGVGITATVVGAEEVAARFLRLQAVSDAQVRSVVRHYGALLRTRVMRNASGRPGPNVITGDYRRSITVEYSGSGSSYAATVGTNSPQARRLEFGFHGEDSLGRHYNQPPFPHFGPAFRDTAPEFRAAFRPLA